MKIKKVLLMFSFSLCTSCIENHTNALQFFEIQNAVQISVPSILEVRNENSNIGTAVNRFRDNYNEINTNKIGKSNLVFQPKGTNNNEKSALSEVTRITVRYLKSDINKYPKWNEDFISQNNNSTNELMKEQAIQSLNEMPFKCELLKWNHIETGEILNQIYLKTSFTSLIENKIRYDETYLFCNYNEQVIISLTTDFHCKEKWKNTFNKVLKTFNFKTKK